MISVLVVAEHEGYLVTDTLRGRHGYKYGECARALHFASKTKLVLRDENQNGAINYGNRMHKMVEWRLQQEHPEWSLKTEQNFVRELPEAIFGVKKVSITADLEGSKRVIEIKPRYSMKAYIQTLVQKFVLPEHQFMVYGYSRRELFSIKADLKMATVYVGRILTALRFLPPRVPNASLSKAPCASCQFKAECWKMEGGDWATFKEQSRFAVDRLQR